jgi:hypothetical protein
MPMTHRRKNIRPQFFTQVALRSTFALLFSFCFVFAQASELGNVHIKNGRDDHGSVDLSKAHFIFVHNQLYNFPFHSAPIAPEPESGDTNDYSDDDHEETGRIFAALSLKERFDLTCKKCQGLQLFTSRRNRTEVSLFILHHSWKIFLV